MNAVILIVTSADVDADTKYVIRADGEADLSL